MLNYLIFHADVTSFQILHSEMSGNSISGDLMCAFCKDFEGYINHFSIRRLSFKTKFKIEFLTPVTGPRVGACMIKQWKSGDACAKKYKMNLGFIY